MEPKYKRVLLKLSGESLAGSGKHGIDFDTVLSICEPIKKCVEMGVEVAVVVGATSGAAAAAARWIGPVPTTWGCWPPPSMRSAWRMRSSSLTFRFGCRRPFPCRRLRSPISATVLCAILKRAASSFSAAAPAIRSSLRIPPRRCVRRRRCR